MEFIKFPSINQYRGVVKAVSDKATFIGLDEDNKALFDPYLEKPVIDFIQTVKIHGTNAGISLTKSSGYGQQSRNRIITVDNDNYGFALWCNDVERKDYITNFLQKFLDRDKRVKQATIYGEFAGQGVFASVAVGQLPRAFYAFSLKLMYIDEEVVNIPIQALEGFVNEDLKLFNILMFGHKTISIDFNTPDDAINDFVADTNTVEAECPVAKYFGVSGVGEGVVMVSDCGEYLFKSKGEKHSVSKVKTLSEVDKEMMNNVQSFVDNIVTENRLAQGIEYLKEMQLDMSRKSTGDYIKWVINDVKKEELDTILANKLDFKMLNVKIGEKARKYFFNLV